VITKELPYDYGLRGCPQSFAIFGDEAIFLSYRDRAVGCRRIARICRWMAVLNNPFITMFTMKVSHLKIYQMRSRPRTDKKLIFNYRFLRVERGQTSALSDDLQDVTKKQLYCRLRLCFIILFALVNSSFPTEQISHNTK
jgi:hypothetical protein